MIHSDSLKFCSFSFVKYKESETYSDDFPIPGHCYGNSYLFSQEDQMTDFALFPAQGYDTFFHAHQILE